MMFVIFYYIFSVLFTFGTFECEDKIDTPLTSITISLFLGYILFPCFLGIFIGKNINAYNSKFNK